FFLVGAYTSAIVTKGPDFSHLGGFGQPFLMGVLSGGAMAALLALLIGIPTLRLRGDYLAIATIGIAETLRLVVTNEQRLTAGVWGIGGIPKPMLSTFGDAYNVFYAALVLLAMLLVYF